MTRCINHPGRISTITINRKNYCAECERGVSAARIAVSQHVEPKACFVCYVGANRWQPIPGTGCAHWVAHQRNITRGVASEQCMEGFPYRVRTLVQGMQTVALANVQVNDIYVTPSVDHTGLVHSVRPNPVAGQPATIMIRHDSSAQGGIATSDFATHFHGRGTFYR